MFGDRGCFVTDDVLSWGRSVAEMICDGTFHNGTYGEGTIQEGCVFSWGQFCLLFFFLLMLYHKIDSSTTHHVLMSAVVQRGRVRGF